jgi:tetratricopeptide (TPR) repeat protein
MDAALEKELHSSSDKAFESYLAGDLSGARFILSAAAERALQAGSSEYYSYFEAELAFSDNNYALAITKYDAALRGSPGNPLFLSNKGVAVGMNGLAEDALDLFDQALAIDHGNLHALVSSLPFLIELGRIDQARKRAKIIIDDNAGKVPLVYRFYAAESLVDLDKDELAGTITSEFLNIYPQSAFAHAILQILASKKSVRQGREFKQRPSVRALLTCDACHIEQGKVTCQGIFDSMRFFSFPASAPNFSVFCSALTRRIRNRLVVSFRDEAGNRLLQVVGRATTSDLAVATYAVINVRALTLSKPGRYTVELSVNSDVIGYALINVVQQAQRAEYTPEQLSGLLTNPKAVKNVRFKLPCPNCGESYALQMNLDPAGGVSEGYAKAPPEDTIKCRKCGTEFAIREPKLLARELLGTIKEKDGSEEQPMLTSIELK